MCGIAGIFGPGWPTGTLERMVVSQKHRGPDGTGLLLELQGMASLGHNRLSIIDLSQAGHQPMGTPDGRLQIVFNGEIYNYRELRAELADYPYRSMTDTEVILAAYDRWGSACLDRLIGMFAFLIWDTQAQRLFGARDRFGVKPLYYHATPDGRLAVASEIKAIHAAGVQADPDAATWATFLSSGLYDHSARTFWTGVRALPPGHVLTWKAGQLETTCWYDLGAQVGDRFDDRSWETVEEEYRALMVENVRLRFRSDVPVGINLSGGLDSSLLLGVVQSVQGDDSDIKAFTFATGDARYDELPWVAQMLGRTRHPSVVCTLHPSEVPALAASVQAHQDEPFGGLPTLAYARLFERARAEGVIVLLDGQGMDEQWAGYDYYRAAPTGDGPRPMERLVQGTTDRAVRPECLLPEFRAQAEPLAMASPFPDRLRSLQYRDIRHTKIPRALRFNDRISMRASTELREPFLDHRLLELALRQPPERTVGDGLGKALLRRLAPRLLPQGLVEAPKRPLQTPQREWLRGPLAGWADRCIEAALAEHGGRWLAADEVRAVWTAFRGGAGDNSFYVWQWVNLGLMSRAAASGLDRAALSKSA